MSSEAPNARLIGFEKDSGLGDIFAKFRVFQDYRATLPGHILGILREQHPNIVIESIELLNVPQCKLGGMEDKQNKILVRVQTLEVPLDLRITVKAGQSHVALDIQLVIICEDLDSTPTVRSDMFVKAQKPVYPP